MWKFIVNCSIYESIYFHKIKHYTKIYQYKCVSGCYRKLPFHILSTVKYIFTTDILNNVKPISTKI